MSMITTTITNTAAMTLPMDTATPSTMPDITGSKKILVALGFQDLSEGTSLYTPARSSQEATANTTIQNPTLLIVCAWAFAQSRHIAKYLVPYQAMYPQTSILLIQNVIRNSIWMPDAYQYSFFQPAASAVQAHLSATSDPKIMMHIFSNGGAHAAVQLSETCRVACGGLRLPVDAVVFDSAPGHPRWMPTVNAMVRGIPGANPLVKGAIASLTAVMVTTTGVLEILRIMEPAGRKLYRLLADPYDVFLFKGGMKADKDRQPVPRTYIFSSTDDMILEEDIRAHAETARTEMITKGYSREEAEQLVKLEEFLETAHVNHVKKEPERYWNIVKETWARSQQR